MKGKKGVLDQLGGLSIAIVIFVMAVVVGALMISEVQDKIADTEGVTQSNVSTWTTAYNTTVTAQTELGNLPDWLGIIVIVVVGGLLIMLVKKFSN